MEMHPLCQPPPLPFHRLPTAAHRFRVISHRCLLMASPIDRGPQPAGRILHAMAGERGPTRTSDHDLRAGQTKTIDLAAKIAIR
jgi:hypothetical protein